MGPYYHEKEEAENPLRFQQLTTLAKRAVDRALAAKKEQKSYKEDDNERLRIPAKFEPLALRAILYPREGYLHIHQDMMMG